MEREFGELIITFTTKFELQWQDKGSGAKRDGAFYRPIPPPGFYPLGSIAVANYASPDGNQAAICVREASGAHSRPPLARPLRCDLMWTDKGSGSNMDGSCWRPVPPAGYVALGDVFATGYRAPSLDAVRCVRADLTQLGIVGDLIYDDRGSGASSDFSAWKIVANAANYDKTTGTFAVNSFIAASNYDQPQYGPVANCLNLPLPVEKHGITPSRPVLNSHNRPPSKFGEVVNTKIVVPFTAVRDEHRSLSWKIQNSMFYTVERVVSYDLQLFSDNGTSTDQTLSRSVKTGVSTEKSETFSKETGITVGYSVGISSGGFGAQASVSMTVTMGFSTTTAVTQFYEKENKIDLVVPANSAAATWLESSSFRVRRADGSLVGADLTLFLSDTSTLSDQFP